VDADLAGSYVWNPSKEQPEFAEWKKERRVVMVEEGNANADTLPRDEVLWRLSPTKNTSHSTLHPPSPSKSSPSG